jgi:hypothetical protein
MSGPEVIEVDTRSRRERAVARAHALRAWWNALEPLERTFYRAVVLLAIGCGLAWPPLAFIVPGSLWALVFFGITFRKGN